MDERELIQSLAKDVKLSVLDENMDTFIEAYHQFLKQVQSLESIQTEGVKPLVFPFEVETSFLREDSIQDVMRREDILKNAKHIKNQQIQIPKVVE
ncbi:Asp-tRNA(Asn)/Glu-tRNA(Gln) amidotransferase subunit GatC [Massilimicrobiota sp. An134]|uniref:Asp-tRNA(Asn)/Glu-tRNA(Gln) amidotransferase subunit GatC n=1 Tax=Massilimicrobiota sp. An134 TaxID=1965557 RepID=UPI000B39F4C7|nr:Asp-tRNA(Asn)/Glu-tRNA(Gln) amidotransferase subunit GatC [Massilimicrobiota sp. An134]OUQ29439.1 aspartyl/glutamyl-tRNA(Asn/Gln) amidotransferase subunit C [Massilimicrobiota sp. An134]